MANLFRLTTGKDTFTGLAGGDNVFELNPDTLQATDTITGGATGAFHDFLVVMAGGTLTAGQFAGVSNVEEINLSAAGNTVTLTNGLVAGSSLGYFAVVDGSGNDNVDGSGITNGIPVAYFISGGTDQFVGGNGDDGFVFSGGATLTSADTIVGGTGTDNIYLTAGGAVGAAAFANVSGVEALVLSASGNAVTLTNALVASSDIGYFAAAGGGGTDAVDATGVTNGVAVAFFAGGSNETFLGGNGSNAFVFTQAQLASTDVVQGGSGTDNLYVTSAGTVAASAFTNVTNMEGLVLAGGNNVALTNGLVAGTSIGYFAVADGTGHDTVDASAVTNNVAIAFLANGGTDTFIGGNGNDSFLYAAGLLTSANTVVGGDGNDTLWMTTAGTTNATDLTGVSGIEGVFLQNGGTFHFANGLTSGSTLGAVGSSAVDTLDASLVTAYGVEFHGNGGADTMIGGSQADNFVISDTSFASIQGGAGLDRLTLSDFQTLNFTSAIDATIHGVDVLWLADAADTNVTLASTDITAITDANTLWVVGGDDDNVNAGTGWHGIAVNVVNTAVAPSSVHFTEYQNNDGAILYVQKGVSLTIDAGPVVPHDEDPDTDNAVHEGDPTNTYTGLQVNSTDQSGGVVTYSLDDDAGGRFGINSANGMVFVTAFGATHIDFETSGGSYDIIATATSGILTNSITFTINVIDVPPSTPVDNNPVVHTIPENSPNGTDTGLTVSSSDINAPVPDTDGTNTVTYALLDNAGNPADGGGAFTIDATGHVTVADSSLLDYEVAHSFTITVRASDPSGAFTSQNFTINLSDLNDTAPAFTSTAAPSIAENTTPVVNLVTTDPDTVGTNPATLTITGGADQALFHITGGNHLSFIAAPDFETPADVGHDNVYNVQVSAFDGVNTTVQDLAVTVADVNDNAPVFTSSAADNVAENTTAVVDLTTTDADTVGTNPPTFTITGGADQALFHITGGNQLSFTAARDFETQAHSYAVQVTANDGTNTTQQNITVTLTDVNDNAPVFTSSAADNVAENTTAVVDLTTTDADTVGTNPPTFTITGGADALLFQITSGNHLAFIAAPDYETQAHSYAVQVTANDGTNTTQQNITVTLTDVNDNAPIFDSGSTASTPEGVSTATAVYTAHAPDADGTAANNTVTYSLASGGDNALFNIDSSSGAVTFKVTPNFEAPTDTGADNVYDITVHAIDNGGVHDLTQAVAITVTDLPPDFTVAPGPDSDASANQVFDGETTGGPTGVHAFAADPATGTVTYSLPTGVNNNDEFSIDSSTGVVTAGTTFTFDNSVPANNNLTITVRAADASGDFSEHDYNITIQPNQPPAIDAPNGGNPASLNVAENTTAVTTVHATDPDSGPDPISYSITGGADQLKFTIDSTSGALSFATAPDFEHPTDSGSDNVYDVVVSASDGAASDTQAIAVTVTDANDAPVITSDGGGATASINVNENTTAVTTVTATDQDLPPQTLTYSILTGAGSPDHADFTIDGSGHLSFVSAPDFETPTGSANGGEDYVVQVQATDNGAPNLHDIQTITVHVQDVNEAPTTNAITTSGSEDPTSPSYIPITVTGSDVDAGDSVASFHITNLPTGAQGVLYTDAALTTPVVSGNDYAATGNALTLYFSPAANFNGPVTFQAAATDAHGPLTDATPATETINVTAVDDPPVNTVPADSAVGTAFSHTALAISGVSVSDIDAGESSPGHIHTTVSTLDGNVGFDLSGGATVSAGTNNSHSVTLDGTVAQVNAALASLNYTSDDGFTGSDTVTVHTDDLGNTGSGGPLTDTDTFHVGVVPQVFVIDNTPSGAGNNGSLTDPYNSIASFNSNAADGSGDYIYINAGTYSEDGINLVGSEHLYGQGQTLSFTNPVTGAVVTIGTGSVGNTPIINVTGAGAHGIDLGSGDQVTGLNVQTNASTQIGINDSGASVGSLTVADVDVTGSGQAVSITHGGALTVTLDTLSSSGGAYGVQLGGALTGSFTGTAGTLSGHSTSEFDVNGGTGNISYGGAINDGTGLSASVASHTGGTVAFSGAITDSNDASGGISLTGNTGGTINFSGGMTLNTGASNAFSATGGGTINVTGTNHLTSTTGTALDVANTTIGASELTFQDISANGATNGIVLNNTGSTGGLNVTGSGAASRDGTGGTIQNTTGDGISLTNTAQVNLTHMNINSTGDNGVFGSAVNGFVSNWNSFSSNGNATHEGAIRFGFETDPSNTGLTGGAIGSATETRIDNTLISGSFERGVSIFNNSGTLTQLNMHGTTIQNSAGGDGALVELRDNAVGTVDLQNSTFTGNHAFGFQGSATDSSNLTVNAIGAGGHANSFTNNNDGIVLATAGAGDLTTEISNNTFSGNNPGTAITVTNVASGTNAGSLSAKILSNTITIPSSGLNDGIAALLSGTGTVSHVKIDGNTITDSGTGANGIFVGTPDNGSSPNFTAIVTNNNVTMTDTVNSGDGINVQVTRGTGVFKVEGNTVSGAAIDGIFLFQSNNGGSTSGTGSLERGGSASNTASVVLAANNPNAHSAAGGLDTEVAGTFTVVANGTITLPLFAAAAGGVDAATPAQAAVTGEYHLTQSELDATVSAAIDHWAAAGVSAQQFSVLQHLTFSISDLPGPSLGGSGAPGQITIDSDAAGLGWYVDPTPNSNSEFGTAVSATDLVTDPTQAAAGHYDLLTTVMHEMGHQIGLDDTANTVDSGDLMYAFLTTGERRLPDASDVTHAQQASAADAALSAEDALPVSAMAPNNTFILAGTDGNDTLNAGQGGVILAGGAGADTFVFDQNLQLDPPAPTPVTHIADYSATQGDTIDLSALTANLSGMKVTDTMVVRAQEDASGTFATLQMNTAAAQGGDHWVNIAQLDGAHAGDAVNVAVDTQALHIAQIHVDWAV